MLKAIVAVAFLWTQAALPADRADRRVAEWVLYMGGNVRLAGDPRTIQDLSELPAGDFRLESVDLIGAHSLDAIDLAKLSPLQDLKELHLPGPIGSRNTAGGAGFDGGDVTKEMHYLSSIPTLERIMFSYHFLDRIRLDDEGLKAIANLVNMRELGLFQTRVRGHTLAQFVNLQVLDVGKTPFDDEGLRNLSSMNHLTRLWAPDTQITDNGLQFLSKLQIARRYRPAQHGCHRCGLAAPASFGPPPQTESDEHGHHRCRTCKSRADEIARVLSLYRTRVTNAGLEALKELKSLREVDVRYSRATQAGVNALRAALPETQFVFVGAAPRVSPPVKAGASFSTWVRAQGGKVVLEKGRVVEVSLASSAVSDADMARLSGLSGLRKLDLKGPR